jgi:hypothetical protein
MDSAFVRKETPKIEDLSASTTVAQELPASEKPLAEAKVEDKPVPVAIANVEKPIA